MKKFLFLSFILILGFVAHAQTSSITLFYGRECSHCEAEIEFLNNLKKEMPNLEVKMFEVWHDQNNQEIFLETAAKLGIKDLAVPLTIIKDDYLIGFDNADGYGKKIKEMLGFTPENNAEASVYVPLLGKIDTENFSLPLLSVVLGMLDGFNPCSMWALITMIVLVLATGSRKKLWLAGWTFIITSYISYFLFMTAWLNAFILLDYVSAVRIIVGIIALVAGVVSVREFYTSRPGVCEVSSEGQKQKITERIKKVLELNAIPAIILGVIFIAFSVNLIELLCSLGFPVVYTKVLTLHNLATWKYYAYIGVYDFFYMLLNIIILVAAGFSMKLFHIDGKISRWSRLIAGILMLILGLIFLLKPELLMF